MTVLLMLNIILAILWTFLSSSYGLLNLMLGFVIGYFILRFGRTSKGQVLSDYLRKLPMVLGFVWYFFWEVVVATFRVATEVFTVRFYMEPAIVAVDLDLQDDGHITLLANMITLTPGTLSLAVTPDRKILYVHTMYLDDNNIDEFKDEIKQGFERRILEVFS